MAVVFKVYRQNDYIDNAFPYKIVVNDVMYLIYTGETKNIQLTKKNNEVYVKYLYFKTKKMIIKENEIKILKISTFRNRNIFIAFILLFIVCFILMSFQFLELSFFYNISALLASVFMLRFFYYCTFGYKSYIKVELSNE